MYFMDRFEAGRLLAAELGAYRRRNDVIVLALPRGGVAVGCEAAVELRAPLDLVIVRKIGFPRYPEVAIGAVASEGIELVAGDAVERFAIPAVDLRKSIARERAEIARQEKLYRGNRPFPSLTGQSVILMDDGLATGHTMSAAIAAVRAHAPQKIVVAVPVGPPETCQLLKQSVDEVICLLTPPDFVSVSVYYDDFRPVNDDEVRWLLARANKRSAEPVAAGGPLLPSRN